MLWMIPSEGLKISQGKNGESPYERKKIYSIYQKIIENDTSNSLNKAYG